MVPASDNIYEYIVFRGSDVKDLRIEEAAPPKENKPPQVPDDPAILGVSGQSQAKYTCRAPRPTFLVMKHIGCKILQCHRERKNPVDISVAFLLTYYCIMTLSRALVTEVMELTGLITERPPTGVFQYTSYNQSSSTSEAGTFPRTTSDAANTDCTATSTF